MRATKLPDDLQPIFDELNQRYFGGKLPRYRVEWSRRLLTTAGRAYLGGGGIRLSRAYHECYPDDIRDTIAHEMAHLWLWSRGRPADHTAEFRAKTREMGVRTDHARRIPPEFLTAHGYLRRHYLYGFRCPKCGFEHWSPVKSIYVHRACFPEAKMLLAQRVRDRRPAQAAFVMQHVGRKLSGTP